jgi:hypothetical protein
MAEIKLKKKLIYSGEVFASLMGRGWGCTEISNFLREFREVDAVEVVRCKDCKHFVAPQGVPCCDNFYGLGFPNASGNDFCSYGERNKDG